MVVWQVRVGRMGREGRWRLGLNGDGYVAKERGEGGTKGDSELNGK